MVPSDSYKAHRPLCPNNNTHVIDPTLTTVCLARLIPKTTTINQDSQYPNGGYYRVDSYQMAITGGTGLVTTMNISYNYNIDCLFD